MSTKLVRIALAVTVLSLCVNEGLFAQDAAPLPPAEGLAPAPSLPVESSDSPSVPDPMPSLGEESTPSEAAKEDLAIEGEAPVGAAPQEADNVYLPPPMESTPYYNNARPQPAYSVAGEVVRDDSMKTGMEKKPGFSVGLGASYKNYTPRVNNASHDGSVRGFAWGGSARLVSLQRMISLWGEVGLATDIVDKHYRLGLVGEVSMSRRLFLQAGIIRDQNVVWWPKSNRDDRQKFTSMRLGGGGEYHFLIGPHYNMGLRGWLEKDGFLLTLTMSLEPSPGSRLTNLNYRETVW